MERIEQLLRAENAEEEEEEGEGEGEGEEFEVDEEDYVQEDNYVPDDDVSGMDLQAMREMQGAHSLMEDDGNPFDHSGGGFPAYGGNVSGPVSFFDARRSIGSVNSADDSDLQRALSQSLLDPYGGGAPAEDSSGFEDDGIMYASLDNSADGEGGPSTPRRWS